MPNYCFNLLTFYGTRDALREAMMLLSQTLPFRRVDTQHGPVLTPLYDEDHVPAGTSVPPLSRPGYLEPEAVMPVPLRYQGFGSSGWHAPTFLARVGFEFELRSAGIPEDLIENADDPVIELVLSCDSRDAPPRHVLQALSKRLPRIVIQCGYEEHANDVFGAVAYQAGAVVATHDVERTVTRESLSLDEDDQSDDADQQLQNAHQKDGLRQIEEHVTPLARDAALTRVEKLGTWSPLTRSACDRGVPGLKAALAKCPDFPEMLSALVGDLGASRSQATPAASWLDACLYGNDALEKLLADAVASPGKPHELNAWFRSFSACAEKCLDLLDACAPQAPDRMFASAMVAVLSDPATRLMTGIHPIALLADACKQRSSSSAADGLRRVMTQMRAQLPRFAEAPLVGVEFLKDEGFERDAGLRNVVLGMLLESHGSQPLSGLKLSKQFKGVPAEHGPSLNPGYVFDPASDALLRSMLHCGLQGGQAGVELALAAGFDESFLFRSLAYICPKDALESFMAIKDVRQFSPEMVAALAGACERVQDQETLSVYGALKAQADMKGVIGKAAPSPSDMVRRRPRGL